MRAREAVDHYIAICLMPFSPMRARNGARPSRHRIVAVCGRGAAIWGAAWVVAAVGVGEHVRRHNAWEFLIGPSKSRACIPTSLSGLRMTALRCRNLLAEYGWKADMSREGPEILSVRRAGAGAWRLSKPATSLSAAICRDSAAGYA